MVNSFLVLPARSVLANSTVNATQVRSILEVSPGFIFPKGPIYYDAIRELETRTSIVASVRPRLFVSSPEAVEKMASLLRPVDDIDQRPLFSYKDLFLKVAHIFSKMVPLNLLPGKVVLDYAQVFAEIVEPIVMSAKNPGQEVSGATLSLSGIAVELESGLIAGRPETWSQYLKKFQELSLEQREGERVHLWGILTTRADAGAIINVSERAAIVLTEVFIKDTSLSEDDLIRWERIVFEYVCGQGKPWIYYTLARDMIYRNTKVYSWQYSLWSLIETSNIDREIFYRLLAHTVRLSAQGDSKLTMTRRLRIYGYSYALYSAIKGEEDFVSAIYAWTAMVIANLAPESFMNCRKYGRRWMYLSYRTSNTNDVDIKSFWDRMLIDGIAWTRFLPVFDRLPFGKQEKVRLEIWRRMAQNDEKVAEIVQNENVVNALHHMFVEVLASDPRGKFFWDDVALEWDDERGDVSFVSWDDVILEYVGMQLKWLYPLAAKIIESNSMIDRSRWVNALRWKLGVVPIDRGLYKLYAKILKGATDEERAFAAVTLLIMDQPQRDANVRLYASSAFNVAGLRTLDPKMLELYLTSDELRMFREYTKVKAKGKAGEMGISEPPVRGFRLEQVFIKNLNAIVDKNLSLSERAKIVESVLRNMSGVRRCPDILPSITRALIAFREELLVAGPGEVKELLERKLILGISGLVNFRIGRQGPGNSEGSPEGSN